MKEVCSKCSEYRRVTVTVGVPSERFPTPIWRYHCNVCGNSWIRDDNNSDDTPEGRPH